MVQAALRSCIQFGSCALHRASPRSLNYCSGEHGKGERRRWAALCFSAVAMPLLRQREARHTCS
jgi:hypothetical protein